LDRTFYEFERGKELDGGATVKEICYAIKGCSTQIRRDGDCNFRSGLAIAHDLYGTMANIDVCTESELLEVKVPIVFLGTGGFSASKDGHYYCRVST